MKALFLDRDGTLIPDKGYLHKPHQVELLPGVSAALKQALDAGYSLFVLTNQSGVGRGYYTLGDAEACNRRMEVLLHLKTPVFVEIGVAPEAPEAPLHYRKPSPRFILEMSAKYGLDPRYCFMVGDRWSDIEAGLNAGIVSVGLESGADDSLREKATAFANVHIFSDLPQFMDALMEGSSILNG